MEKELYNSTNSAIFMNHIVYLSRSESQIFTKNNMGTIILISSCIMQITFEVVSLNFYSM